MNYRMTLTRLGATTHIDISSTSPYKTFGEARRVGDALVSTGLYENYRIIRKNPKEILYMSDERAKK